MKISQASSKATENDCNNIPASRECNSEYLNDFLIETKEHLEKIELNSLMLENDSANRDLIDCIFRDFHTIKGLAGFVSQTLVQKVAHQTENIFDKLRKDEISFDIEISDIIQKSTGFISGICNDLTLAQNTRFVADINIHLQHMAEIHSKTLVDNRTRTSKRRISIENYEFSPLRAITKNYAKHNSIDRNELAINDDGTNSNANNLNKFVSKDIKNENNTKVTNSLMVSSDSDENLYVRIPMKKIDALIGVVGELIISHSQIEQYVMDAANSSDKLSSSFHRVNTLTKDIQNISMSLRMVSLKSLFQRIYRMGIDTVDKLGKNVEITISGEDTEIDRNVVEKLVDPLIHLINNSIYHGIEDKTKRIKNGKPPIGKVKINASSKKGIIYIEVSDDGRGIDIAKVLEKAISKNLAAPSREYTDQEILNFIFLPGLSTLEKVDDISGRGVGLDIVKTEIAKIGGRIEISNIHGNGCSFTLRLPVNMTIIKGTIVEIAGAQYIVPLIYISAFAQAESNKWINVEGIGEMFEHRDELIPVIDISKTLGLDTRQTNLLPNNSNRSNNNNNNNTNFTDGINSINHSIHTSQVLILESEKKHKVLPVDRIIENRDVIVKSLGTDFENLSYVFGASILGDGKIAIILNVESFFAKEFGNND